jgi:hypothetical protein
MFDHSLKHVEDIVRSTKPFHNLSGKFGLAISPADLRRGNILPPGSTDRTRLPSKVV